jgi:hypothetical protein
MGCGEGCSGGAVAVGGDQLGDVALIEAIVQAPRALRARSRDTRGAGECRGIASLHVSGLYRVRVSGKYLHHMLSGPDQGFCGVLSAVWVCRCECPVQVPLCGFDSLKVFRVWCAGRGCCAQRLPPPTSTDAERPPRWMC